MVETQINPALTRHGLDLENDDSSSLKSLRESYDTIEETKTSVFLKDETGLVLTEYADDLDMPLPDLKQHMQQLAATHTTHEWNTGHPLIIKK